MSASLEASFRIPLHNRRKWHNIETRNGCARKRREMTTTIRDAIEVWNGISCIYTYTVYTHHISIHNLIIVRTCFRTSFVCVWNQQKLPNNFAVVVIIIGTAAAVIVESTFNWLMLFMIESVRLTEKKNNQLTYTNITVEIHI